MAAHSLFRLWQLPTPNPAISVHRRREQVLPFLAPKTPVVSEHEQHVFTTVCPTTVFARTHHTVTPVIIPLLKQRREEERREQRRAEERKVEPKSTAREDFAPIDVDASINPISPIVCTAHDLSTLSSGARNPWGSLQRRNRRFQPHEPRRYLRRSVNSFTYPTNSNIYKTPRFRPSAITIPVIETIRHPYGIGPTKPVVRVPVAAPSLAPTQPALPTEALVTKTDHSIDTIHCHCGRLISVSKVSQLPTTLHPTFRFISDFISFPLFFPAHLFSCFGFS